VIHVFDNILNDPEGAISDAFESGFNDVEYDDGIVYPDICTGVSDSLRLEVVAKIQAACRFEINVKEFFFRRSKKSVKAPHWAHVDTAISSHVAIIYLSDPPDGVRAGTAILEHIDGWRGTPTTEDQVEQWKRDTNDHDQWKVVDFAEMKKNRMIVHSADELHAAFPPDGFGGEDDGRLVLIVFFDEKDQYIRMARAMDGPELTELFMEFAREHDFQGRGFSVNPLGWCAEITNDILNNPYFGCFVAIDNGQVVASCGAVIGNSWLDRRQLVATERFWYVTPKFRKTRLGISLFDTLENWAKSMGAEVIDFIALESSDEKVSRFYKKRGFRPMETHFTKELEKWES
jgi:GNAT superfamily N-acetyltransferase